MKINKIFDLKTIIILILIGLLLFLKMCSSKKTQNPGDIVKIDGKKYEILKHIRDTLYVTNTKTIYRKGDEIPVPFVVEIEKPAVIDTMEILKDYYSKLVYQDTFNLDDSLGNITLVDTIQKNRIIGRKLTANVISKIIKDSIIVKELPKIQLYVGPTIGYDRRLGVNFFGSSVLYKTKKDDIYGLGVGLNRDMSYTINASFLWKIKLK